LHQLADEHAGHTQSPYGLLTGGPPARTRPRVSDAPSSHKSSQGETTSILTPGGTLTRAGKNTKLVCVAIARELCGFLWDIVRQEMPSLAAQAR